MFGFGLHAAFSLADHFRAFGQPAQHRGKVRAKHRAFEALPCGHALNGEQFFVVVFAGDAERVYRRCVVFHRLGHVLLLETKGKIGALRHVGRLVDVVRVESMCLNHPRGEGASFLLSHVHQHGHFCRRAQAAAGHDRVFYALFFQGTGEVDKVLRGAGQDVAELDGLFVDFLKRAICAVGAHHRYLEVGRCLLLLHIFAHRRGDDLPGALGGVDADVTGH